MAVYVKEKGSRKVIEIFSVKEDKDGNIYFLAYENNKWIWKNAENYYRIE